MRILCLQYRQLHGSSRPNDVKTLRPRNEADSQTAPTALALAPQRKGLKVRRATKPPEQLVPSLERLEPRCYSSDLPWRRIEKRNERYRATAHCRVTTHQVSRNSNKSVSLRLTCDPHSLNTSAHGNTSVMFTLFVWGKENRWQL